LDAEVVYLNDKGMAEFDTLHSRNADKQAIACAFDLLAFNVDDLRRRPLIERKAALAKLLIRSHVGIQYVEHAEGDGAQNV
jgi:bifunctional non-homologous end joining protein LigD